MHHPSKTFAITFLEWHEGIRIKSNEIYLQNKLWSCQNKYYDDLKLLGCQQILASQTKLAANSAILQREFLLSFDTPLIVLQIKFHNFPNQSGHTAIQTCALSLDLLAGFPADLCLGRTLRAFRVNPQEEPVSRRNNMLVFMLHE